MCSEVKCKVSVQIRDFSWQRKYKTPRARMKGLTLLNTEQTRMVYSPWLIIVIIIIIIIIEFLTSQPWLGNIHLSWDVVINRIRLGGLICSLKSFLQLNICQELQIFAVVCMYSGASYYYCCCCCCCCCEVRTKHIN